MSAKRTLLICGAVAATVAAVLLFTGSVVLLDSKGEVASARLIDGWGHKQPLLNLWYLRVALPRIEGAVQISCRNGREIQRGYVAPGIHTWQQMYGTGRCSTIYL